MLDPTAHPSEGCATPSIVETSLKPTEPRLWRYHFAANLAWLPPRILIDAHGTEVRLTMFSTVDGSLANGSAREVTNRKLPLVSILVYKDARESNGYKIRVFDFAASLVRVELEERR